MLVLSCFSGSLPLGEVAGLFDRATLERLRKECGGMQTLLRNQHQVFEGGPVAGSGEVWGERVMCRWRCDIPLACGGQ